MKKYYCTFSIYFCMKNYHPVILYLLWFSGLSVFYEIKYVWIKLDFLWGEMQRKIEVLGWQLSSCRFLNFNFSYVIKCFWHNVSYHSKEDVLFYRNLCLFFLFELISVNFQIIKMVYQVEKNEHFWHLLLFAFNFKVLRPQKLLATFVLWMERVP